MRFSQKEIKDLLKSWVAISIAFAIIISKSLGISLSSPQFSTPLIISAFTVGIAFLLHELGHKFVAQRYHFWAEFRSFDGMLVLAIAMSFLGFIFAAPGAVMIHGYYMTKEKNGRISAAGPLVNIILAIFFLSLFFMGINNLFIYYGVLINSWIALFNLIPIGNIDGKKILNWNKTVYTTMLIVGLILLFTSSLVTNI
jgi:Zn-dependent protease